MLTSIHFQVIYTYTLIDILQCGGKLVIDLLTLYYFPKGPI